MIVSASYRTDIPAFYPAWFLARLDAGFCRVRNPYGGKDYEVSLGPGAVTGLVLWTRNLRPLAPELRRVAARAPFIVQFTVLGYPRVLDRAVIGTEDGVAQLRALRRSFGPRAGVWRYDPVVLTSLTPPEWHLANFAALARALEGAVDEVVVSFVAGYRKTRRNLDAAAARAGLVWRDPGDDEKRDLAGKLAALAAERRHDSRPLRPARLPCPHGRRRALYRFPALVRSRWVRARGAREGQPAGLPLRRVARHRRL